MTGWLKEFAYWGWLPSVSGYLISTCLLSTYASINSFQADGLIGKQGNEIVVKSISSSRDLLEGWLVSGGG